MRLVYCLLSPTFGMHQYTADLANRMVSEHDVYLVTVQNYPSDRYDPAITVVTHAPLKNSGLSSQSLNVLYFRRFLRSVISLDPSVVHFTGPHLWNPILLMRLKAAKVPVVHTLHDLEPHSGARFIPMLRFWNNAVLRLADRIVVHGSLYKQKLAGSGVDLERIFFLPLLHLFLGFDRLKRLENNLGDIQYRSEVLFFGRIQKYKGLETLVTAFQKVLSEFHSIETEVPKLHIAGNGTIPEPLKQNLPSNIAIINRLVSDGEAENLFRRCSAVVLPYDDATQSALIAAAYFFQKPVIVTDTGALPEYVENGVTGYIVPPSDSTALARVMSMLLSDKESAEIMGKAGRAWYDDLRLLETQTLTSLYN